MKNRSFVFFSETQLGPTDECVGAQGIPLTPWRSLAVDPSIHVYGTPIWIDAKFPINSDLPQDTFQHLMFAQDTGSAIRGAARADIYFGHGEDIPHIAGRIKQFGKFVMLVPKDVSVSGTSAGGLEFRCPGRGPKDIGTRTDQGKTPRRRAGIGRVSAAPITRGHELTRRQPAPRAIAGRARAVDDRHQVRSRRCARRRARACCGRRAGNADCRNRPRPRRRQAKPSRRRRRKRAAPPPLTPLSRRMRRASRAARRQSTAGSICTG